MICMSFSDLYDRVKPLTTRQGFGRQMRIYKVVIHRTHEKGRVVYMIIPTEIRRFLIDKGWWIHWRNEKE